MALDWHAVDLDDLRAELRATLPPPDAERTIWAFERALAAARVDDALLDALLAAAVCLRAFADEATPREILERFFRRAVTDDEWRERFAPLLR